ncbi:MAG: TetR family transcriptional regulator [Syntrophorhabdaceae bacterium]|nr:TetR family transcriptional regulator [Syntrophorhabdaceae bacterium]
MVLKNTQELLLNVATELFYKKGYSGTSIRDVGIKAKMSNSLLYHYFKNKEEMLFQVISSTSQDLIDVLREIDQRITDPLECLKEMLYEHVVGFGLKRRKESKIVVEEHYWLTGRRKEAVAKYERQIYDIYSKKLQQIAETGQLNDLNVTVLTFSIFGIINWFYKWYREGGRLSPPDVANTLLELLLHGMIRPRVTDTVGGQNDERKP